MQLFARITKIDEATRRVYGVASSEAVDHANESLDYDASKGYFIDWSNSVAKATDGKSVGNLRAMHGNVVAGKLVELQCDDVTKSFPVCAEVVDDNEWNKTLAGCYTGFSIGGSYVSKQKDETGVTRYVAKPNELSLVDLPCNPDAAFTVVKADGAQELRKFVTTNDNVEALQKWAAGLTDAERAALLEKIAARSGVDPREGEEKYGDVAFADEKNKKYPINTAAHIRAAWNYINKPKNAAKYDAADLATIKRRIVAAWKEKIDSKGPPSAQKDTAAKGEGLAIADSRAAGLLAKIDQAEPLLRTVRAAYGLEPMAKGMYGVANLAGLVASLDDASQCAAAEAAWEGDNSAVPEELRSIVTELAGVLLDMADEEVEELVAGYEKADTEGDLTKNTPPGDLHKGAPSPKEDAMDADLKKSLDTAQADLAKAIGERDELKKGIAERDELLLKAAAALDERNELIKKLEAMPEPVKVALRSVSKSDDIGDDTAAVEKVLNRDGTVDEAATAIKKALLNPVVRR